MWNDCEQGKNKAIKVKHSPQRLGEQSVDISLTVPPNQVFPMIIINIHYLTQQQWHHRVAIAVNVPHCPRWPQWILMLTRVTIYTITYTKRKYIMNNSFLWCVCAADRTFIIKWDRFFHLDGKFHTSKVCGSTWNSPAWSKWMSYDETVVQY